MKFDPNYPPIKQIDDLEDKVNHSMVLYDKEEYGQLVINRFIENGLKKGENVVCFTYTDVKMTEKNLEEYGIDVNLFKQRKQLHIIKVENTMKNIEEIKQNFEKFLDQIIMNLKIPFRFTGRTISNISTKEGIEMELVIEEMFHSKFDKRQYSFLCPYQVESIEDENKPQWLGLLMKNHHNLIYATEPEKSVTFATDLIFPLNN